MNSQTSSHPAAQGALRLLMVVDNRADAEQIVATLKQAGYSILYEIVESDAALEEKLARAEFDLMLSDHNLGHWTGMEALALLRKSGKDIPFLVVTTTLGDEAAVEYIKAGAADYLPKHRLDRLPAALARVLREKSQRREVGRLQDEALCAKRDWELTFDAVRDVVLVLDEDGNVQRANRAAVETLGLEFSRIIGHSCQEVIHCSSEVCPRCPSQRLRESGRTEQGEFEEPRLHRTFDAVCAPLRDPDGGMRGSVLVMRDITERRQLEKQLFFSQKAEAIGRLAGGIAHDFNNLLGVVMGFSELTLARMEPDNPLRSKIEQIQAAGERGISLTRQLLAFSRQQMMQPRVLDLNAIISEAVKMLQHVVGADVEIAAVLHPKLGSVKADPSQMEQVLMNLVVNARDAMPEGGRLTIETGNAEIDESYVQQHVVDHIGSYVLLTVSDTGIGMDVETRSHIFEPFFTTKEVGKGTGLGLSTVYGIVKQSGGYIWVYSEPGAGATFKIYLPRVDAPPERRERRRLRPPIAGHGETILLLEDEADLRELMIEWLREIGYTVLEAKNGRDALDISAQRRSPIDLLLTDVVMPGMGGRELAEKLAASRPSVRVLYISGHTRNEIGHRGVLDPDVSFLQKPFTREALAQKISDVLTQKMVSWIAQS